MNSEVFAKRLEIIFFPSRVIATTGIILIIYFGARISDFLAFIIGCISYYTFVKIFERKTKSENVVFGVSGIISTMLFLLACAFLKITTFLIYCALTLFVTTTITLSIRFFWKISGHVTTLTCALMVLSLTNSYFSYFFPLVPLVAWSRLKLKVHTLRQVIAGFLLGVVIPLFLYFMFSKFKTYM